jgi:photosystem II stability/assembly factor-like uncharacterized protein
MINKLKTTLLLSGILLVTNFLSAQTIVNIQQGKQAASIRGMAVINDSIAWISGSKGAIAITHNGGKSWDWQQVKGFEKADFRAIEAFSDKEAIIMSSGTPALVLKTIDGGANWQVKYKNTDTSYFFDAMGFTDHLHGYILGDPVGNKFLIMETRDGGETWNIFKNLPDALPGEAAFAASGTCLRVNKDKLTIASGGTTSVELTLTTRGSSANSWQQKKLPFPHQKASQGAFSVAINGSSEVFVGGDYANDKRSDSVACYTVNSSSKFIFPKQGPASFQSCVEYAGSDIFISTGTSGSNITMDGGKTWVKVDDNSFNVCGKAKHGKLILLAGNGGKTGILKL